MPQPSSKAAKLIRELIKDVHALIKIADAHNELSAAAADEIIDRTEKIDAALAPEAEAKGER